MAPHPASFAHALIAASYRPCVIGSGWTSPWDYECGKLRPHADMLVGLAKALRVSTYEMLGVQPASQNGAAVSRQVLRRLQAIDHLPKRDQDALFRTIDAFL